MILFAVVVDDDDNDNDDDDDDDDDDDVFVGRNKFREAKWSELPIIILFFLSLLFYGYTLLTLHLSSLHITITTTHYIIDVVYI